MRPRLAVGTAFGLLPLGLLLGAGYFHAGAAAPAAPLSRAQSEGRLLAAHRGAFGYTTQAAQAAATGIPATRISLIHRGLDTLRPAEWDSLAAHALRQYGLEFDTLTARRLFISALRVAPPPPATAPLYPQQGVANNRMTAPPIGTPPYTYRVNALRHGLSDSARVVLRWTGAAPNIDQHIFFVRAPNVDELWLYRDSLLSVPVVVTRNGLGGTVQRLP